MANRVLLVESDFHLAEFWEKVLTEEGLEVVRVTDPNEVSAYARKYAPDVVFLGSNLTGAQELVLLTKLRQECPALVVIAPLNEKMIRQELTSVENMGVVKDRIKVDQVRWALRQALSLNKNGREPLKEKESRFPSLGIPKLAEMERYLIEESLTLAEGNQTRAAKRLGISRFALRNRMRRYGILLTRSGMGGRELKWEKQDSISIAS